MPKKRAASLLSKEQWLLLFKLQKGRCPICLTQLYIAGNIEGRRAAAVDHSHTGADKGRVRGLVCSTCNRHRIGTNTPETAHRLATYLSADLDARKL